MMNNKTLIKYLRATLVFSFFSILVLIYLYFHFKAIYIKRGINLESQYEAYISNCSAKHVISHRGSGASDEIEHTFAAYDQAIASGSHYIEQDLVSSKEGTLWVSHDPSAQRIFHYNKLFRDMTDSEIQKLKTANNEHCHRLSEVFNHYKKDKDVNFVVEVRTKWDFNQIPTLVKTINECKIPISRLIIQCWTKEDAARIKNFFLKLEHYFYAEINKLLKMQLRILM